MTITLNRAELARAADFVIRANASGTMAEPLLVPGRLLADWSANARGLSPAPLARRRRPPRNFFAFCHLRPCLDALDAR